MSNPNFVSDLVAMAKAFEELPDVKAALEAKTHDHDVAQQMIQRLELRLIDLKNEVDAAHAATRRVEVERDHAERMFLETDDRLNAFRRLLAGFQTEAGALIAAAEPVAEPDLKPEPVTEIDRILNQYPPQPEGVSAEPSQGQSEVPPLQLPISNTIDSGTEASGGTTQSTDGLNVSAQPEAVSVPSDPTPATGSSSENDLSGLTESAVQHSEVAAPADPTASSTVGNTPLPATVPTDAAVSATDAPAVSAPTVDDVGYHNEPRITTGEGGWQAWDDWCVRMNQRYGGGSWPTRPATGAAH